MPGTPMDQDKVSVDKLQVVNPQNGQDRDGNEAELQQQQQRYRLEPRAQDLPELTQTDKLNKRLLDSLLQRMNKSVGEFDRFMDGKEEDEQPENLDEEIAEF